VVTESTSTPSLASERGSLLIEVLVAAVLVAVIGVALFGSLNSAAQVSGKSKTRAGAAAIAQDDQERMRAMPVAALNNFRQHRDPVVMGKIAYVVDSRAEWIADAKGATDCTSNGAAADYLKITSTVTAKSIALKPVVVTSTVTPAPGTFTNDEGSLAVSVVGADGTGRANVQVSIDGPASDVQLTDANGCAFFGYEPVGDYDITATASGYVDPNGNASATGTSSIGSQTVATLSLKYDQAGQAKATFTTTRILGAGTETVDSFPGYVGFSNPGVTSNQGARVFGNGTPSSSIDTTPSLFPFPSAYSVFAGDCFNNDPLRNGAAATSLQVLPGKLDHTIAVSVPALNLTTLWNGAVTGDLSVTFTSTTASCTPKSWVVPKTNNGSAVAARKGLLDDPGLPYGSYKICVDNRNNTGLGAVRRTATVTKTINAATGTAAFTMDPKGTGSTTGQCPNPLP
jgi:Tfp pilus assembly protein PilV